MNTHQPLTATLIRPKVSHANPGTSSGETREPLCTKAEVEGVVEDGFRANCGCDRACGLQQPHVHNTQM